MNSDRIVKGLSNLVLKTSKIRLFLFPYANGNLPPKPIASQEEKKAFPFAFFIYYLKQCNFILLTLNRSQAAAYKDVKTRADQLALTAKRLPGHLQESTVDSLPLNDHTCQRQPVSLNCHPLMGSRVTKQGRGASGVHSAQEYVTQQSPAQPYIRQPSTDLLLEIQLVYQFAVGIFEHPPALPIPPQEENCTETT